MTAFTRARRSPWSDARFSIGLVLVLASVTGVWFVVSSSHRTAPVLQANRTIVVGEAVSSADFDVVEVSLGAASESYVAPHDLSGTLVATRTLEPGELLPTAAVGPADEAGMTTLVIESSVGLPEGVRAGARVELWHAPQKEEGFGEPRILIADATVASIVEQDGMLAASAPAAELVIARSDVADVLTAITDGDALSIVPLGADG